MKNLHCFAETNKLLNNVTTMSHVTTISHVTTMSHSNLLIIHKHTKRYISSRFTGNLNFLKILKEMYY